MKSLKIAAKVIAGFPFSDEETHEFKVFLRNCAKCVSTAWKLTSTHSADESVLNLRKHFPYIYFIFYDWDYLARKKIWGAHWTTGVYLQCS